MFNMSASYYLETGVHNVTQCSPSPTISGVYNIPSFGEISRITSADSDQGGSSYSSHNVLKDVHISAQLLEDFLELAKDNTDKDMETCGVLGAFLRGGTFYVTTLIIPKQESTSSSCHALHEEEIFAIQNEQSLVPVGWIHTHPSQSCFMSSVDLHTQFSYQIMVPEAVAIVMAPTDKSSAFPHDLTVTLGSYGIFRLSDPDGLKILEECQEKGFHIHKEPSDGNYLYEHCSNVYVNPNLRFEIFDLR